MNIGFSDIELHVWPLHPSSWASGWVTPKEPPKLLSQFGVSFVGRVEMLLLGLANSRQL